MDGDGERKERAAIIVHSGSYDRVYYALSISLVSLAMGMDVNVLFTYSALKRLVKERTDIVGDETDRELRIVFEKGLTKGSIQSITTQLRDAKRMGLKIYACVAAMATLNITREELIEEVDEVVGLAAFLDLARNSALTLYV